jgi:hypothetical protein
MVQSARPRCPEHLRPAFIDEPAYVALAAGEHLYKFVSIPIVRERVLQSPWWMRQAAFDECRARARALTAPTADYVRARLAIAPRWNPGMDTVYVVVLGGKVDAWEGRARHQPAARGSNVSLLGGGSQVAVPDLTWRQIALDYSGTLNA